ncbi:MAG TPA: protein kinase, partial [Acetobacteraceae bacterium]|nr:protein kinase [Acetobacteraceae bacterium]
FRSFAYIVMEFVEGGTLKSILDRGKRLAVPDALRMMDGLLAGLAYSHANGVIHRDIKPANIIVTADGRLKLADFGVARIESSSLTQAGTMIGTPSYMSPEQFMGQPIDARSDIYSAGVLLYQLLTGEKPFEGSVSSIMHKVLNVEPPPPSALSVSVAPAMDAVVRRAMAKRPEQRFGSAGEFAAALREAEHGPAPEPEGDATRITPVIVPAAAPPPAPARTGHRLWPFAAAALVIVLLAGLGAFLGLNRQRHPPGIPAIQAALDTRLAPVPCALLRGAVSARQARLSGLIGAGQRPALDEALQQPPVPVAAHVRSFTGPYCPALSALRPYAPVFAPGRDLGLSLAGGATRLVDGQNIVVDLAAPAWPAFVEVDYLSSDGSVYRLYPNPQAGSGPVPAKGRIVLGDPKSSGEHWVAGKPYGRDMIIAVAGSAPFQSMPETRSQRIGAFAATLKAELAALKAKGERVAIAAMLVDTAAK